MMKSAAEHATMSNQHWGRPCAAASLTSPLRQEVRSHVR